MYLALWICSALALVGKCFIVPWKFITRKGEEGERLVVASSAFDGKVFSSLPPWWREREDPVRELAEPNTVIQLWRVRLQKFSEIRFVHSLSTSFNSKAGWHIPFFLCKRRCWIQWLGNKVASLCKQRHENMSRVYRTMGSPRWAGESRGGSNERGNKKENAVRSRVMVRLGEATARI